MVLRRNELSTSWYDTKQPKNGNLTRLCAWMHVRNHRWRRRNDVKHLQSTAGLRKMKFSGLMGISTLLQRTAGRTEILDRFNLITDCWTAGHTNMKFTELIGDALAVEYTSTRRSGDDFNPMATTMFCRAPAVDITKCPWRHCNV